MDEAKESGLIHWKESTFLKKSFSEIQQNLHVKEMEFIAKETQSLVSKNMTFGGSEHGFYYKSELFIIKGAFGKTGINLLDPSLEEDAEYLRLNRMEIQQHLTYIAHFLGALERFCEGNPSTYCANTPQGLIQLSETFSDLDRFCRQHDLEFYQESVFDRKDKTKIAFFSHYDRIDGPINRFLFRRVVKQ